MTNDRKNRSTSKKKTPWPNTTLSTTNPTWPATNPWAMAWISHYLTSEYKNILYYIDSYYSLHQCSWSTMRKGSERGNPTPVRNLVNPIPSPVWKPRDIDPYVHPLPALCISARFPLHFTIQNSHVGQRTSLCYRGEGGLPYVKKKPLYDPGI